MIVKILACIYTYADLQFVYNMYILYVRMYLCIYLSRYIVCLYLCSYVACIYAYMHVRTYMCVCMHGIVHKKLCKMFGNLHMHFVKASQVAISSVKH